MLKQKSRIQWLKDGDKNAGFFHNQVKHRWNINKIMAIENAEGVICTGHLAVQKVTVDHFRDLLGTQSEADCSGTFATLDSIQPNWVSSHQALLLEKGYFGCRNYVHLKAYEAKQESRP